MSMNMRRFSLLGVIFVLSLPSCAPEGATIGKAQYAAKMVGNWQGTVGDMKETISLTAQTANSFPKYVPEGSSAILASGGRPLLSKFLRTTSEWQGRSQPHSVWIEIVLIIKLQRGVLLALREIAVSSGENIDLRAHEAAEC